MSSARIRKVQRTLAYARPQWPALSAIVLLALVGSGLAVLQPWPLKILVDYGLGSETPSGWLRAMMDTALPSRPALIFAAGLASIAVFVATAAVSAALTLAWTHAGQRMVYHVASDLFLRLQRLSLLFHSKRSVGDSLSRITGDAWSVYSVVNGLLVAPARDLVVIASIGAVAWQLDADLTLLMLIAVPPLVAASAFFGGQLKAVTLDNRRATAQLTAFAHQVLGAMPAVQVFAAEGRNQRQFAALAEEVVRTSRSSALVSQSYGLVNAASTTLGFALVLYAGGERVLAQQMSVGTLLVFVAYVRSLDSAVRSLLGTYGAVRSAEASIERVCEVLESNDLLIEAANPQRLPDGDIRGRVTLEDVTFGYEPGRPVLDGVTLEIRPGETLALVGASGAGKTTLASLVARFFDPWGGRVMLDGVDVRHVRLADLRSEISLVLQDPFILPLSIADNIAYGCPGARREDVVASAIAANAHDFISRLPDGYDTVVGEQGATLSGGEQQRIAIARALLKNARVLILDEPTSALDAQSEQLVMEAFERLMKERTTLVIAHRLSTVRRAGRIAVLNGGRVLELGTHEELLAAGGAYARLHRLHAVSGRDALG